MKVLSFSGTFLHFCIVLMFYLNLSRCHSSSIKSLHCWYDGCKDAFFPSFSLTMDRISSSPWSSLFCALKFEIMMSGGKGWSVVNGAKVHLVPCHHLSILDSASKFRITNLNLLHCAPPAHKEITNSHRSGRQMITLAYVGHTSI